MLNYQSYITMLEAYEDFTWIVLVINLCFLEAKFIFYIINHQSKFKCIHKLKSKFKNASILVPCLLET